MKYQKLSPEENTILLDFIWKHFESGSWDKSWYELYCHVMIDAHIWKALGKKVNDDFIKELRNESI